MLGTLGQPLIYYRGILAGLCLPAQEWTYRRQEAGEPHWCKLYYILSRYDCRIRNWKNPQPCISTNATNASNAITESKIHIKFFRIYLMNIFLPFVVWKVLRPSVVWGAAKIHWNKNEIY